MLDGRHKAALDRRWEGLADVLIRSGVKPNQITWTGLLLVFLNCVLYPLHRDNLLFGLLLAFSFGFDALDGAVARLTGTASRYGAYLDAVVDRYQEVAVYLTLALVTGYWLVALLAVTGSMLVSYNKARTALEVPIENNEWPDLMQRFERLVLLCLSLILDELAAMAGLTAPAQLLYYALWVIAVLAHVTAVQRFVRARRIIAERGDDSA
jgi:phosphatidylglycerophosphate synthase